MSLVLGWDEHSSHEFSLIDDFNPIAVKILVSYFIWLDRLLVKFIYKNMQENLENTEKEKVRGTILTGH